MALFAITQAVHRETGFSLAELVFGKRVRGPLDILYAGWAEDTYQNMSLSSWVENLKEKLEVIQDCAYKSNLLSATKRNEHLNKNKSERTLEIEDTVLMRIPGLRGSLEASWEGPYTVVN